MYDTASSEMLAHGATDDVPGVLETEAELALAAVAVPVNVVVTLPVGSLVSVVMADEREYGRYHDGPGCGG